MISDLFTTTVLIGILTSGIRLATPYLFASIGEMFGQRSGVLNLGVEGMMLMGAFAAFYVTLTYGNPWLGLLAAIIVGGAMGLAMAFISVTLGAEQGISGIGIYLFGLGMSDLLFQKMLGSVETVRGFRPVGDFLARQFPDLMPTLLGIPVIGSIAAILAQQNIMVYLAYALGRKPGRGRCPRRQRDPYTLCHRHYGRRHGRYSRRVAVHRVAQRVPTKPDQRPGFHRCRPGLFRRLAALWCPVWGAPVQYGQRPPIVDPGAEYPDSV